MVSIASQLLEEVTVHAQSDSLEDERETCADGTYFPNNLHKSIRIYMFTTLRVLNVRKEMSSLLWEVFELDLTKA